MSESIPVYIGTSASGEDAESQAVVEYTLRKYASEPVDITWLKLSRDPSSPWYGWSTKGWGTPFTGLRWGIPAARGFEGRAIYTDGDVICRADIAGLWKQKIPAGAFALVNATCGKELRTCVMLIDCVAAKKHIPPIELLKRTKKQYALMIQMMRRDQSLSAPFKGMWNCVDLKKSSGVDDPEIKMIHYSSQTEQVHFKHALQRLGASGKKHWFDGPVVPHRDHRLQELFDEVLAEAVAAGYSPERYVPAVPYGDYAIRSHAGREARS